MHYFGEIVNYEMQLNELGQLAGNTFAFVLYRIERICGDAKSYPWDIDY
jgi:hypothetical protein